MYLVSKGNGVWEIHGIPQAVEGPSGAIASLAKDLGVDHDDLVLALDQMADRRHDYAHFGALGHFIMTGQWSELVRSRRRGGGRAA